MAGVGKVVVLAVFAYGLRLKLVDVRWYED